MNGWAEAMMMYENAFYDMRPNELEDYNKVFTRVFDQDVAEEKLIWHRDKKDRTIRVISGVGWKFQHDNELPFVMNVHDKFKIKKESYHRIHKGEGKLILEIEEHD
tara:strand:+ start:228 stop:545 length:318 start_codon:yes stop_codon:yes gene_type:complete